MCVCVHTGIQYILYVFVMLSLRTGQRNEEGRRVLSGADLGTALIISQRKRYIQPMTGPFGMHTVIGPGLHPDSLRTIHTWSDAKVQMAQRKTFPPENNWPALSGCRP